MSRRIPLVALLAVLAFAGGCTNKKVTNPLKDIGSKQPDKVLFDRAMDAMKHNHFDVARLTLQTLINTYPDSEFIARAKLGVADSWYAEGGSASLAQAELEYQDFKTFFPNMPEAAEAQLKIANIHYQQMEKSDRDYTHALRAEQEYRNLIMQFPEQTKLVAVAKQRLLEVQEVLAEREFLIGRFYYMRPSYPAAIARLKSVVDQYPLYSRADEALYLLGQSYEAEITVTRNRPSCQNARGPVGCIPEGPKGRLIADFTQKAADAYSRILTRYPVMDRSDDAKARLIAMHQPVPRPTKAALAQNKAEEDSRRESSMVTHVLRKFSKHPDVAQASRVGEPTLVDPQPMSASQVVQQATKVMIGAPVAGSNTAAVEMVGKGAPPADQAAPRSDTPSTITAADPGTPPAPADANELAPNVPAAGNEPAPDPNAAANELTPNVSQDNTQALPPPAQVNEIQAGSQSGGQAAAANGSAAGTASSSSSTSSADDKADDAAISSSKHKKKKGLKKVLPL
jgi:outer membrane protein assembly factor BamD